MKTLINTNNNDTQVLSWHDLTPTVHVHEQVARGQKRLSKLWREVKYIARCWQDGYEVAIRKNGWSVKFREQGEQGEQ